MAKIILNDIAAGYQSNVAANTNNTLIETAIENTLSRDGTAPNQMEADFDMNNNRILNLPEPLNNNEPARLADVQNAIAGGAANLIPFTPAGNIVADNVQTAIEEVDTEKVSLSQLAASNGSSLVGFIQSGAGAEASTVQTKLRESVSVLDFGVVGDGVTDDTLSVSAIESSSAEYVDMLGKTVLTTLDASAITKNYFNGTLLYETIEGNPAVYKNTSSVVDLEIQNPRTKSPVIDWEGKRVLWLGTSIPQEGQGTSGSYPDRFGDALSCSVENMAWAGSHAGYDVDGDAFDIGTVKSLSMTEDDRAAGEALYGPTSAYADGFDLITSAFKMTADYRIKDRFIENSVDCVVLDHNHNDRRRAPGTLSPTSFSISSVTIGTTTLITLASGHTVLVGDAVALEINGIPFLNHAAARVQSVAGNDIVINVDSSGYTGSFVSGSAIKLDRSTIYGAWEFLIHYILNCSIVYGSTDCKIILAGAPNEYTVGGGRTPHDVYSNARFIKNVADKWGVAFFDIGFYYGIKDAEKLVYFPDGVHPSTDPARQSLANMWVEWASGGALVPFVPSKYIPAGVDTSYLNQREALYSEWIGGFGTPNFIVNAPSSLHTDAFDTLVGWTLSTSPPVIAPSPWDSTNSLLCSIDQTTNQDAERAISYTGNDYMEFDVYLPVTKGLISSGIALLNIARMATSTGAVRVGVQLVIRNSSVSIRANVLDDVGAFTYVDGIVLEEGVKYTIRVEHIKATSNYNGACRMYVDGVLTGIATGIVNSATAVAVKLRIGGNQTAPSAMNIYFDNLDTGNIAVLDYSTRASGSFTTVDGKTATVVNGIITVLV